jgi:diguanylate cyclase (GGDEF)-like protein
LFYLFYAYSVIFFTIVIITIAYFRALPLYRLQSGTILAGTLTPLVGNILFNVIIDQSSRYIDPTPLLFTIMCIFYAQGLFGFRLFDVIPIARDSLIEHMSDGVVVVDTKKRIVDINPAALRELDAQNVSPIGRQLSAFFGHWPLEWVDQNFHQAAKIEISGGTAARFFELSIEPLFNWRRHFIGSLFVLRDITSRKQSEVALQKAKEGLQDQIDKIQVLQSELRDQAQRDALTGLFNRRYLKEIMPLELMSASSRQMPLSVIMIDIDHFKEFNDKFGHEAGDIVLQSLADMLRSLSRTGDVICRYGGEEFVIVLPNTSQDSALHRAEEWCDACKQLNLVFGSKKAGITLSAGVAVFPRHGITTEDLLRNADDAMYHSKRAGRNMVSVAEAAS